MSYEGDPAWHLIRVTAEEEEAWLELEARLDRESDYAPASALGGAAPPSRPPVPLSGKDGNSPEMMASERNASDSRRASPSSAGERTAPRPFSSSPSAAGLLLVPPSPAEARPRTSPESEAA